MHLLNGFKKLSGLRTEVKVHLFSMLKSRLFVDGTGWISGAGGLTKKGQGTRHLYSPRGSILVSSRRGTSFARERALLLVQGEVCPPVMVTTHPTASTVSPPHSPIITSKRYSVGLAYPAARGIGAIGQL